MLSRMKGAVSTPGGDGTIARCIVTSSCLHIPLSLPTTNLATSSSAMFARMNGQETTIVDIFFDWIRMVSHMDYGTRPSVHEAAQAMSWFVFVLKMGSTSSSRRALSTNDSESR